MTRLFVIAHLLLFFPIYEFGIRLCFLLFGNKIFLTKSNRMSSSLISLSLSLARSLAVNEYVISIFLSEILMDKL